MASVSKLEKYTTTAKGIAWDGCHKIYILLDSIEVEKMRGYGYENLITSEQMDGKEMAKQVWDWYRASCPLRLIDAVSSVDGFITVEAQR